MTRKIVALCLLILIPVTLNCMAGADITSAWAYAMAKGRMGDEWIMAFGFAALVTCGTVPGVGLMACGAAGVV